jgi:hypothetical protein
MENFKFEINDQNEVIVYEYLPELLDVKGEEWFVYDVFSSYPDGTAWTAEQALDWGNKHLQSIIDEDAPYAPIGPNLRGQLKSQELEIELLKKEFRDKFSNI